MSVMLTPFTSFHPNINVINCLWEGPRENHGYLTENNQYFFFLWRWHCQWVYMTESQVVQEGRIFLSEILSPGTTNQRLLRRKNSMYRRNNEQVAHNLFRNNEQCCSRILDRIEWCMYGEQSKVEDILGSYKWR